VSGDLGVTPSALSTSNFEAALQKKGFGDGRILKVIEQLEKVLAEELAVHWDLLLEVTTYRCFANAHL
jgi:hypothetical protein